MSVQGAETSTVKGSSQSDCPADGVVDALVVGAGFGGLYAVHKLRQAGFTVRAFEKGSDVGGVWYWNRYPGARCDVESMQYSYSFDEDLQQQWRWPERFAAQPDILAYAQHVSERFDLRRNIAFNTGVTEAHFDEGSGLWQVGTDQGEKFRARFCIFATGCLSTARMPEIAGIGDFKGGSYHTGHWPHEGVDFSGQRVGVIGTGSSGIQAIPMLAQQAKELVVFQRTANFSIPARNAPMDDAYERSWKDNYAALRQRARDDTTSGTVYEKGKFKAKEVDPPFRESEYLRRWLGGGVSFMHTFNDLMLDAKSNVSAADFVRSQILAIVRDSQVAELLAPKDHPIGTKRICVDTDYFDTYNRRNVTLVDLRQAPIERITATGLQTAKGLYELDSIVFATGYDAMTGSLLKVDIRGRDGQPLAQAWEAGPRTYLGLMVAGFPNLFMVTGPGSPSVLANMIFAIEQHVDWIVDCLRALRERGVETIEAEGKAQDEWVAHVNVVADKTLFKQANSWYLGANVPGKPRVFMPYAGGVVPYRKKCEEVAAKGYEGFHLRALAEQN